VTKVTHVTVGTAGADVEEFAMSARTARNIALLALVVVAFGFAVETAVMGLILQHQGESPESMRILTTLSVTSLMIAVFACWRALFVVRPATPPSMAPTHRAPAGRREKVLAA